MSDHHDNEPTIFGVAAQFGEADQLLAAAEKARSAGYAEMDAYSPIPVHGVYEAMGNRRSILLWIVLCAGITGGLCGFGLQYWISVIEYPMNVGGRPHFSWVSFIPVIFECTILFSALTAVFGMFTMNGLPMPYHPIFNAENFELASRDKFFLCIEATDPKFDEQEVSGFMNTLNAENVCTVDL
jgi:hypothetical protein